MEGVQRIFIECTHTLGTDLNTGIQRVVRNILNETQGLRSKTKIEAIPVVIEDGKFFRAAKRNKVVKELHRFANRLQTKFASDRPNRPVAKRMRKLLYPKTLVRALHRATSEDAARLIEFRSHDVLLMLDSSWHLPAWDSIKQARENGCVVGAVYYDLIPVQYPQYFTEPTLQVFGDWLNNALEHCQFFASISGTTSDYLREYALKHQYPTQVAGQDRFDSFKLGADICRSSSSQIRESLRNIFANSNSAPWLSVGTVEPRKNHRYLIDAFDEVYRQNPNACLCIAGKEGWKVEELVERIRNHPELNKRLFWFSDLTDAELQFAYQNSKALIFPSIIEGFGLPIVEAMHYGLPAFASDTKIHREVGGQNCNYFGLEDPQTLAAQILKAETNGLEGFQQAPQGYKPTTWQESALELISKCADFHRLINSDPGTSETDNAGPMRRAA